MKIEPAVKPMRTMSERPLSVTMISWLFLIAGVIGVAYHASEFRLGGPFQYDLLWVCLVRLIAIVCAVFMLRASNWARWLLVVWIAYHVVLSGLHSPLQFIVHGVLLAVVICFLFNAKAAAYFRGVRAEPAPKQEMDDTAVS